MMNIIKGFIICTMFTGFIIIGSMLANVLANMITMKTIMKILYIFLGFSIVYIIRN